MFLSDFFETQMAHLTDVLTRVRTVSFVRNLQLILVLITLATSTYFLSKPYLGNERIKTGSDSPFIVGNFSPETIVSTKEIIYDDLEKTNIEKIKAYNSGAFIFERDNSILSSVNGYINEDFDNLDTIETTDTVANKQIYTLISKNPRWKKRKRDELKTLLSYNHKKKIRQAVLQSTNYIFSTHCIMRDSIKDIDKVMMSGGNVYNRGNPDSMSSLHGGSIFPRSYIYDDKLRYDLKLHSIINDKVGSIESTALPLVKVLTTYYVYSFPACTFNAEDTEKDKLIKKEKVQIQKGKINPHDPVVRKGELITPEVIKKLEIMNQHASTANIASILSLLIIQIIFVGIISSFLKRYDSRSLNDVSSNVIVFSLIWILTISTFIASKFFYHPDASYETIYFFTIFSPIGMVCLLLGFIYDKQLSVAIGFYLSIFIFIMSRNNPTSFFLAFTTVIVSAVYGNKLTKRIDFIKSGIWIAGIQMMIATSGYLIDSKQYWVSVSSGSFFTDLTSSNIFNIYVACLVNGLICITVAQFLLPLYEYIFNIPTRFKLMELADTGHPLLQDLLTKAPSTYTHTFMVAALSERAAQNLKLNWLLTRVGVYYHDIGKIPNAGFFIENQHLIPKPEHIDKNNPSVAASVVIQHVTDGIEMAKKARLPREVIDFIPEHHGTSTMAFFYHKALSDLSEEQRVNIKKEDFQYPGPKPQRKETGIVMIADSVEAASRSLDSVTAEAIDELTQKIINIKLAENQLDESKLTIGDLAIIKSSFREVLLSSLHSRPKYPKPEDTKKLEHNTKTSVEIKESDTTKKDDITKESDTTKEDTKLIKKKKLSKINKKKVISHKKKVGE
jgi:cyclic-di-AMP phosphodiesterase PgpH